MFRSHLTYPHVASDKHSLALSGDPSGALPGMGDVGADPAPVPQIPAPLTGTGDLLKRLMVIGGIAVVVYLILKQVTKK